MLITYVEGFKYDSPRSAAAIEVGVRIGTENNFTISKLSLHSIQDIFQTVFT